MDMLSNDSSVGAVSDGRSAWPRLVAWNSRMASLWTLVVFTALIALISCALPRIPQPQSYHSFADKRNFYRIPNFDDVLSNLLFAIVGIWGLVFLPRSQLHNRVGRFLDRREVLPYTFVFGGLLLTTFGSSYYHLNPDNARLVWDRLPMTITFMSMVAAIIAERIKLRLGLWLPPILLFVGWASVWQWYWSETKGAGDLRFYAAVQAYAALVILLAIFLPRRYTRNSDFGFVLGFYVLAKALELFDKPVFDGLHIVSGHTLKHLLAAGAGFCILRMLQKRTPTIAFNCHSLCSNGAQQCLTTNRY